MIAGNSVTGEEFGIRVVACSGEVSNNSVSSIAVGGAVGGNGIMAENRMTLWFSEKMRSQIMRVWVSTLKMAPSLWKTTPPTTTNLPVFISAMAHSGVRRGIQPRTTVRTVINALRRHCSKGHVSGMKGNPTGRGR